jgi:hypothetical protein
LEQDMESRELRATLQLRDDFEVRVKDLEHKHAAHERDALDALERDLKSAFMNERMVQRPPLLHAHTLTQSLALHTQGD